MNKDHQQVWRNCLSHIYKNVNEQSYKTWFEPIRPVRLQDSVLTIQVPNRFFYEWLEEHYVSILKKTIHQELGQNGRLEYQILMAQRSAGVDPQITASINSPQRPATSNGYKPNNNYQNKNGSTPLEQKIANPFVIPGIKKPQIDPQLRSNFSFDSYIEGDCNRLARSAGLAVAKRPGGTSFNPLVIFGDTGLGKTHLAQAIGNEILQKFQNKVVLYVSSDSFTNQFIESLKNNETNQFVNFYQLVDVLIVDDIQFLAKKYKTQEIFFHIFNQLHQNGKQLILTSDRPPKDLDGMQERLLSRFKWGLSADLQVPDLETRIAIVQNKMQKEGVAIPNEVAEFISYNLKSNVRELEGALVSLIAQSSLNNRTIDLELAKQVVKNFVTEISKEITIELIQKLVANHYEIKVDTLQGKTRKRSIVIARQLSMYLAKNLTNKSLKAIGENFGGRDHSTVIYSCRAVQDMMDTDNNFKSTVADLEKKIKMSLHG